MLRWLALLGLLSLLACGDEGGAKSDANTAVGDGAVASDGAASSDADPNTPDADPNTPDADPGAPDAALPDFGPVDCRTTADCITPTTCIQNAPGGICSGCGPQNQCGGDFSCFVGACVRDCQNDGDCSAGKRCTASNRCAIRTCGAQPCPFPYLCVTGDQDVGLCQRPSCVGNNCPLNFTCDAPSQICMEPDP